MWGGKAAVLFVRSLEYVQHLLSHSDACVTIATINFFLFLVTAVEDQLGFSTNARRIARRINDVYDLQINFYEFVSSVQAVTNT